MKDNEKICRKVRCIETGIEYASIKIAQTETKIQNINKVVTGKRKTAGGYHWTYA